MSTPTATTYTSFQEAYDYFNLELFEGALPPCMITLRHKRRTLGYFYASRFVDRTPQFRPESASAEVVDEIALNASCFDRGDRDVCSTLVHEMAHLWQCHYGKMPPNGYHNAQWGQKMIEIGLMPSETGQPGGKRTGTRMSHWIVPDGAYEKAFLRLVATGFFIAWGEAPEQNQKRAAAKMKVKYTCVECGQNAWAKPGAQFGCGVCSEEGGAFVAMEAA